MADRNSVSARTASDTGSPGEEVAAIPLVEERLSVEKRVVENARVRVRVDVEEHEEIVTEQLMHDELHIERVPRNARLTEVPSVRLEGNVTIVPVVEEVAVVEKVLVLVEEIRITRRSVAEEAQVPVMLRVEQARVEREPTPDGEREAE
jgi:uncharacterized protein (TIGR02271 family)